MAVECIIDRIPVNEARRVDITVRLKDLRKQTPTALLKVDGWNQIRESSETNNQKTRSYTAHQRTDLTIRFCGQPARAAAMVAASSVG